MPADRRQLQEAAQTFRTGFATKEPLNKLLEYFSKRHQPMALEHGLRVLTPFTGAPFQGLQGVTEYFETISSLLTYDNMSFSNYVVDADASKVSVRGEATFTWTSTGQSWPEVFTYTLQFDEELKVKVYEVWADTGAAYLASKGELTEATTSQSLLSIA